MILLWIAVGGGIGSVLRYLMYTRIDELHATGFPIGILVVNIIGSFFMGLLAWVLTNHIELSEHHRLAVLVGLLGGFTTFSSFSHDTLHLFLQGQYFTVLLHIVLSVVLCIMAAGVGLYVAKSL